MQKLSTGVDATLGNYLKVCLFVFGADAAPCTFLKQRIKESEKGEDEEVLLSENQMVFRLGLMFKKELEQKLIEEERGE